MWEVFLHNPLNLPYLLLLIYESQPWSIWHRCTNCNEHWTTQMCWNWQQCFHDAYSATWPLSLHQTSYISQYPHRRPRASGREYDTRCYNRPLGLTTPAHRPCTCHHLYAAPAHLSSHLPSPLGLSQLPVNTCFQIIAFALVIKTKQTPVLSLETSPPNKQSANDIHGYQVQGCPV